MTVRQYRRWVASAAACVVAAGGALMNPAPVGAAAPAPLSARAIADRDQPAIDLIETETTATLTIYLPTLDIASVVSFAQNNNDIQQALSQQDDETAARIIIQEISNNVPKYLEKGDGTSYSADIGAQGSGFTVTPDGYIVTNAHVGAVDEATAASEFLQSLPDQQLSAIRQAFVQQFGGLNDNGTPITIPSDQNDAVDQLLGDFVGQTADVSGLNTTVTVFQGAESANSNGLPARLVTAGKPFPDKDVAILKVDGQNLPTVPIGDDTQLHDGDPIYAIGYPGDATFDKDVIKTTKYTSTISSGIVSNRLQSSAADYQYIEHTATTNHGNSGGALINSAGDVVGITTASDTSTEAQNGVNGGKFFYAVPVAVVRDFFGQAHVTPGASPAQKLYLQGIQDVEANKLGKARKKFEQAQAEGFNTPYLASELALTNGASTSSGGGSGTVIAIVGGGVAVVVIGLIVFLVLLRRRRTPPAAMPATAVGGPGGPPAGDTMWATPTPPTESAPPDPGAAPVAPVESAAPPEPPAPPAAPPEPPLVVPPERPGAAGPPSDPSPPPPPVGSEAPTPPPPVVSESPAPEAPVASDAPPGQSPPQSPAAPEAPASQSSPPVGTPAPPSTTETSASEEASAPGAADSSPAAPEQPPAPPTE